MRIRIVGSGYVGLASGACFADFGHEAIRIDKDRAGIDALLAGRMPICEPGLDELVGRNVAPRAMAEKLGFTCHAVGR